MNRADILDNYSVVKQKLADGIMDNCIWKVK
jgi:hypothetical protein